MFVDPQGKFNAEILNKVKEDEEVGIDKTGKLYVVKKEEGLTAFFTATFSTPDPRLNKIVYAYATDQVTRPEYTKGVGWYKNYQVMIQRLGSLLSENQKVALAISFQTGRCEGLVQSGYPRDLAEAVVAMETCANPNTPESMKLKIMPELIPSGISGSYFVKNLQGKVVGVFKPKDEEDCMPRNPKGFDVPYDPEHLVKTSLRGYDQGTGWIREVAASEVGAEMGVPTTLQIEVPFLETHKPQSNKWVMKVGSLQQFVPGESIDALTKNEIDAIPTEEIQRMAALDLLIDNGDRHLGNMLYDNASHKLHPIDHGLAFLDDSDWIKGVAGTETNSVWVGFPQVQLEISKNVAKWLLEYPIEKASEKLRRVGLSENSIRAHRLRLIFLQEGVARGLSLNELAICCSSSTKWKKSWLYAMKHEAIDKLKKENKPIEDQSLFLSTFKAIVHDEMQKLVHGEIAK